MSTGTKIALTCVVAGVVFSALAGEISGVAWALAAGFWIWQHEQQRQQNHRLRALNWKHVTMLVSQQCPPQPGMTRIDANGVTITYDGHLPTSQGGTRPHLCVCGKPLEEHR